MRASASAWVKVQQGQPFPPVPGESLHAGWEWKQSQQLARWRGRGQGEGGDKAKGRAGGVRDAGRWRACKDSKTPEGWKMELFT